MKKKLLKTTLFASLAVSTIASSIVSFINIQTKKTESSNNRPFNDIENYYSTTDANESLTASAEKTTVTFTSNDAAVTFTGNTKVTAKVGRKFCTIPKPVAIKDGRTVNRWVDADGNIIKDSAPITKNMVAYPYFDADVKLENCLTMVAIEESTITVSNYGTNNPDLQYSTNGLNWDQCPSSAIRVAAGTAVYLKGTNPKGFSKDSSNYTAIAIGGSVNVTGNVMALIDGGQGDALTIPNSYCFTKLFENASGIVSISSHFLPATTLKSYCYDNMFKNCIGLKTFPNYMLPAVNLSGAEGCYKGMFENCTSLTSVDKDLLKATTLSKDCYFHMFRGCAGLTTIGEEILPATTLAEGCYKGMFRECTNIESINVNLLNDKTLAPYCYYGMFASCQKLTDLSLFSLNASNLSSAAYCYEEMFYNCIALTKAPALPATILGDGCYSGMFYNCSSLISCPTLSASTMKPYCYSEMFYNCTTLTSTATLSSTSLASHCYDSMYRGCSQLTTTTTLPAKTLKEYCYFQMYAFCTSLKTPSAMGDQTGGTLSSASHCCDEMFTGCSALTTSPALPWTAGAEYCYNRMFENCTSLTKAGKISLSSVSTYSCYMMFMECEKFAITKSSSGTTLFFTCPNNVSAENSVDAMFQGTLNASTVGHTPDAGTSYYYE